MTEQAEILELAAQVIEQQPPVTVAPVRVDVVNSVHFTDMPAYDGRGLVERLHARLANVG